MPAYNFQKQFADAVERGEKCQTIRKEPKNGWPLSLRVGARVSLYTGMRTKRCRLLRTSTITKITPIWISPDKSGVTRVYVDGKRLDCVQQLGLARADGFETAGQMLEWFARTHGAAFDGKMIAWEAP